MAYSDYQFYTGTYMGNEIPAADFAVLAERASEYIDYLTINRVPAAVPTAVKKACCAIAEQLYNAQKTDAETGGGALASQSVGSWSASYRSLAELTAGREETMRNVAVRYLVHTGLLYRGMR